MNEKQAKRKLAAILSADVKGYSRLMEDDEEATVRTITGYREVMTGLIEGQNGKVVDAKGDNLLAEFPSVVDAVRCAVKVQKELKLRNNELPENKKMEFRIGINLGDVIEEEETIYGDGVNIAARLEGLAEGGGICISRTAFDQVKNKLDVGYEYLGEHSIKNIAEPVRVYKVLMEPEYADKVIGEERPKQKQWRWAAVASAVVLIVVAGAFAIWHFYFPPPMEVASVEKMAFPLPDKPSIAVLPFENMSGEPKQEYFSDGLTDQIINGLSKIPNLFVISRNSTFTYKGKPVKVQQVSEELGVRYVLEGGVQKAGDRIRITAQLIDAIKGHHVWSERYDRVLEDIFAIQDDITLEIAKAMRIELIEGEQARLWHRGTTTNLKAYEKVLEGMSYNYRYTKEDNTRARQLFEQAIALHSGYANAYSMVGWTHWNDARFGWVESRAKSMKMAFKYAQKAIELDDTLDYAHTLIGGIYLLKRQYEKNIAQAERAISLNPNGAHNNIFMAGALGCSGRWEESIGFAEKAMRLAPFPPTYYFWLLGRSYFMTGQYDKAVETFKKAVHVNPDYLVAHAFLAACYISLDRQAEAAAEAKEVLRINPKFSLESYTKTLPYKNRADIERYVVALRKAGLPDKAPLPLPDKPSIAVLPFTNMSDDPRQEYFSDGITEEIITALSKTPKLFVIARNSSFTYKGKSVMVQQVGRELGTRYVLEGSVRKAGNKVRITAQLVDAQTGHHLWAERYDRELKDIFALQDEITMRIIAELRVNLTVGESARLRAKGTENLQAYLKYIQGSETLLRITKEDNALARKIAEDVIVLDPQYAAAYRLLGATYWMDVFFGLSKSPKKSIAKAMELNQKAIALDDSYSIAHCQLGWLYTMTGKHEEGITKIERALELAPNDANAHMWMSYVLRLAGRNQEAIRYSERAVRLNPIPPSWYFRGLALNYLYAGRYDEAITACKKGLDQAPNDILTHVTCAAIYGRAGLRDAARAEAEEVLKINPKFSALSYAKRLPYKNQADRDFFFEALRKAGLK